MTENEIIKMLEVEKVYMDSHGGRSQSEALAYAIEAVKEIQQYRAIGTIEEFKALKEKNEPKKPLFIKRSYIQFYACPHCSTNEHYEKVFSRMRHCENCGGAFDWE